MAKTYGKTASGVPITDELVAELAEKAEAGNAVDEVLRRLGDHGARRRVAVGEIAKA